METFGKRLKDLRVERGLTQVKLAQDLQIDKSTIAKYETDKIEPSLSMFILIVKYFGVSAGYMAGLED